MSVAQLGRAVKPTEDTMKIAQDTMKVIGVFLIAGLAGCSDDTPLPSEPDAAPGPVSDAAPFCSLDTPSECQKWWLPATQGAAVPKSIGYNKLAADALMFNALLRNPRANLAMTKFPLEQLLDMSSSNPEVQYFQLQLQDPFARRTMDYLVGCALPRPSEGGPTNKWDDPVSGNTVTWEGDFGLCPSWQTNPMDQKCQELLSACLLARNNALDREVLISVRGAREQVDGSIAPLPLEYPAQGGEPRESHVESFETPCASPMTSPMNPEDNCQGWESHYIGSCRAMDTVKVSVTVDSGISGTPLFRICHGVSGCDYVDPASRPPPPLDPRKFPHVESSTCSPGTTCDISFQCSDKQAFTLMYANVTPRDLMPPGFTVAVKRKDTAGVFQGIPYPATEEQAFPWQEGAFYGNVFCDEMDPCYPNDPIDDAPVDFSLWVEVCGDVNDGCEPGFASGTVVYHWPDSQDPQTLVHKVYVPTGGPTMPPEDMLLKERGSGHASFLATSGYTTLAANQPVYQRMYSCMSPNWVPGEALAHERLCAGTTIGTRTVTYCAARSMGRCRGSVSGCSDGSIMVTDTGTNPTCATDDETAMSFPSGDRDYGRCSDGSGSGMPWSYPLTVFLNDPCDIVPETEYYDPAKHRDKVYCENVPLCRQTTSRDGIGCSQ
jgi:hypothetical protein